MRRTALAIVVLAACGSPSAPTAPATTATGTATAQTTTGTAPTTPAPAPAPAPSPSTSTSLVAARTSSPPALDGDLSDPVWATATPTSITTDYAGTEILVPTTTVRFVWSPDALFVAFDASFDPPLTAPDAPADTEYEHLYGYDVVELFVDGDPTTPHTYREIELGPLGHTLDVAVDLDARPHGDVAWSSGTEHAQHVDDVAHHFTIEARIPASALGVATLAPGDLRIGLFRITGHSPAPRLFLARFPTHSPRPNFHVPEAFGTLTLAD